MVTHSENRPSAGIKNSNFTNFQNVQNFKNNIFSDTDPDYDKLSEYSSRRLVISTDSRGFGEFYVAFDDFFAFSEVFKTNFKVLWSNMYVF